MRPAEPQSHFKTTDAAGELMAMHGAEAFDHGVGVEPCTRKEAEEISAARRRKRLALGGMLEKATIFGPGPADPPMAQAPATVAGDGRVERLERQVADLVRAVEVLARAREQDQETIARLERDSLERERAVQAVLQGLVDQLSALAPTLSKSDFLFEVLSDPAANIISERDLARLETKLSNRHLGASR